MVVELEHKQERVAGDFLASLTPKAPTNTGSPSWIFSLLIYEAQWSFLGFISQYRFSSSHIQKWKLPPGEGKIS